MSGTHKRTPTTSHNEPAGGELSRRRVLTAAAVTAGAALASAGPATGALAGTDSGVATGPKGSTTAEFRGRIAQTGSTGQDFHSYGYLYTATGTTAADLFDGTPYTVGTALFTVDATGSLAARVFDQAVHALDIAGTLTVYQRNTPGADFNDPTSFTVGTPVATFAVTIQDVLTVFAPGKGLPTITGDMKQTAADKLAGSLAGQRFGSTNQRLRMLATGLGTLVDPATFNSIHEVAGNWTAE